MSISLYLSSSPFVTLMYLFQGFGFPFTVIILALASGSYIAIHFFVSKIIVFPQRSIIFLLRRTRLSQTIYNVLESSSPDPPDGWSN